MGLPSSEVLLQSAPNINLSLFEFVHIIIIIIINNVVALSQNFMLQDHVTVSSHAITNQPTLHDSKYAGEDALVS